MYCEFEITTNGIPIENMKKVKTPDICNMSAKMSGTLFDGETEYFDHIVSKKTNVLICVSAKRDLEIYIE